MSEQTTQSASLADFVLVLLQSTLEGLAQRLEQDGYGEQAAIVQGLTDSLDEYMEGSVRGREHTGE